MSKYRIMRSRQHKYTLVLLPLVGAILASLVIGLNLGLNDEVAKGFAEV